MNWCRNYFQKVNLEYLIPGLTLFLLAFHSFRPDIYELVLMIVIPFICFQGRGMKSPYFWAILGGFSVYAVLSDYVGTDNHKWLYMYWILAIMVGFFLQSKSSREDIWSLNARFFLVFSMGLSVFWKIVSPDFMDGAFMEYTFLTDDRFEPLMGWIGIDFDLVGSWYEQDANFQFMSGFQSYFEVPKKVSLLAVITTWWVILSEGAIALFFAINKRISDIFGHLALIFFIFTTYLIAPVIGFGSILVILGLCVLRTRFKKDWFITLCYFLALVALAVYDYLF